jgi:PIN domain nuclease of toxin-antitoxin system
VTYLFDTQLLVWALRDPKKLSANVHDLIDDNDSRRTFSVVAIWESSIKSALGKPTFDVHPALMRSAFLDAGFLELPVTGDHALVVRSLPPLHRDPFDRMLVAQAIAEGLTLVTADKQLAAYPARVLLV